MEIADKVRWGYGQRTAISAEIQDKGDIGDIDTGKWRWW